MFGFLFNQTWYLRGYPDRVPRSEGLVADLQVENAWKNKQKAAGCCGSWKRNRRAGLISQNSVCVSVAA